MVASRADARTSRSAGVAPLSPGGHGPAPAGINFHDLREAIQVLEVVIGSVDRLREEILPDICWKLRSIALSSRTAHGAASWAPGHADASGPSSSRSSSAQPIDNTMGSHLKQGGPSAVSDSVNHADGETDELRDVARSLDEGPEDLANGQTNAPRDVVKCQTTELRDVVGSLHEHLEERMQAMHQQHARQWDERFQALFGESHVDGQTSEFRDVVRSLHEHLEERMQAMYQQHSTQWEERLQALLGEARTEHAPVVDGQAGELRDVVRSLHERLEERMQAMYQQHSTHWEGRLQAPLGEARTEHAPVADVQTGELRDVRSLDELLEERMQAVYQQHPLRREERLQALLGEAPTEHAPVADVQAGELRDVRSLDEHLEERTQAVHQQHPMQREWRPQALDSQAQPSSFTRPSTPEVSFTLPSTSRTSLRSRSSRSSRSRTSKRHQSPCVGQWRDLQGLFWHGSAIVIAEEGWHPLGPGMSELEPAAANPIEFLPDSRCKLLLPPGEEENSQGAPFAAELSLDDSLIVTPMDDAQGGASFALTRVASRRRRKSVDKTGGLRLLTPKKGLEAPSTVRNLTTRLASLVNFEAGYHSQGSLRQRLRNRKQRWGLVGRLVGVFLTEGYELVQVVMVVLDAVVLAWRTQHAAESLARSPHESAENGIEDEALLVLLNDLFCLWFTLDLVGRALAEGRHFFRPAVLLPHAWEAFIVAVYILEASAMHGHYGEGSKSTFRFVVGFVSLARTLRLLRLVHMSELVRRSSAFQELRMMLYALQGAMKSLAWSLVMLAAVLLFSGMVLTNGYLRHVVRNQEDPDGQGMGELTDAFGTLSVSMFTLMKTVTGGEEWGAVYPRLGPLYWPYKMFYVLFQIFATLALLNVITAVFVESTMQHSTRDRAIMEEISNRRELLMRINDLFGEFDGDANGQISIEELEEHMQNTNIAAYLASLGVDVDQVGKLFLLLDQDSSGTIDREEFLHGFSQLKGDAKRIDLAMLQSDMDQIIEDVEELAELMRRSVAVKSGVSSRQSR